MSTRSPYSLMKIYKHFLKDFELEKNKKMLSSMKFQNGAQIQDGRQNLFIV
jgi:predicted SnoaL-like aldol condensation-catalyzing enzyme